MPRMILLTGAATSLGFELGWRLAGNGYTILGIYRTESKWTKKLAAIEGITLVQADLSEMNTLSKIEFEHCDTIIHLAATSPSGDVNVGDLIKDNVIATSQLISHASQNKVCKFIFMSTMSVYGQVSSSKVGHYTSITNPSSYGATKRLNELQLEDESQRMACVALRIPALLGEGTHRHWLGNVMQQAKLGQDIVIFNPASQYNNAIHIKDLALFIMSLIDSHWVGFHALPLGLCGALQVREIVSQIIDGIGSSSKIIVRETSSMSFTIDYSLAETKFGYAAQPVEKVIDKFIADQK
ncbi:NAD(P)-dependent oxidoreductase [Alphaproteobacteria bacterium]|nr:NAD(P)-dependent oxidoreductase [Alphaproteobacteria bacterium]